MNLSDAQISRLHFSVASGLQRFAPCCHDWVISSLQRMFYYIHTRYGTEQLPSVCGRGLRLRPELCATEDAPSIINTEATTQLDAREKESCTCCSTCERQLFRHLLGFDYEPVFQLFFLFYQPIYFLMVFGWKKKSKKTILTPNYSWRTTTNITNMLQTFHQPLPEIRPPSLPAE